MISLDGWIGTTQTLHDTVAPGTLARFVATIGSAAGTGSVPQGFHWCLCLPDAPMAALGADGHPLGGLLPPSALPRRMWAASDVRFCAPLAVSAAIRRVSKIAGITEKSGQAGRLIFIELEHVTHADDVVCIVERQTIVYREAASSAVPMPATAEPAPDLSSWPWQRSITPRATLLFRYSALTFNTHRIHYDLPYAMEQEGYPGLVVHGPLIATLLLDLCARASGRNGVSRLRFRAMAPAFADQELHLVGRPGDEIELRALGADGRVIVAATATPTLD